MGQYWTYINIDKGECFSVCKLGETIWDGSAEYILFMLAVPVKPSPVEGEESRNRYWRDEDVRYEGSWAGDRIILIGDYTRTWPSGLGVPEDFKRIRPDYCPDLDDEDSDSDSDSDGFGPQDFYRLCTSLKQVIRSPPGSFPSSPGYNWVLRNLSKKEFIRSNGMPTLSADEKQFEYTGYGGLKGIVGLSHALPCNLGWSDDPSCAINWKDADTLCEGRWAGDRIDARLMNEHLKREMERENWKDLSREQAIRTHSMYCEDMAGEQLLLPEEPEMR